MPVTGIRAIDIPDRSEVTAGPAEHGRAERREPSGHPPGQCRQDRPPERCISETLLPSPSGPPSSCDPAAGRGAAADPFAPARTPKTARTPPAVLRARLHRCRVNTIRLNCSSVEPGGLYLAATPASHGVHPTERGISHPRCVSARSDPVKSHTTPPGRVEHLLERPLLARGTPKRGGHQRSRPGDASVEYTCWSRIHSLDPRPRVARSACGVPPPQEVSPLPRVAESERLATINASPGTRGRSSRRRDIVVEKSTALNQRSLR